MELTREQIVTMSKCGNNGVCTLCFRNRGCHLCAGDAIIVRAMASALLVEINKPKVIESTTEKEQDVKCGSFLCYDICEKYGSFTEKEREIIVMAWDKCLSDNGIKVIPTKTRIDEIAEEAAKEIEGDESMVPITARRIKSAILQARKEWEAER